MPVVTTKSTAIQKRDSNLLADARIAGAHLKEIVGVVAIATTDSVGSKYILGEIPSNARVSKLFLSCTDSGTTGAIDIGLYRTTKDGGAVADVDMFCSAQLLTTALNDSNVVSESGTFSVANREKMVWELLGLTEDPNINYDIVATLTAVAEAAADVAVKAVFAQ
jgi:hypothetical protein